jgi:hypothetical protein
VLVAVALLHGAPYGGYIRLVVVAMLVNSLGFLAALLLLVDTYPCNEGYAIYASVEPVRTSMFGFRLDGL